MGRQSRNTHPDRPVGGGTDPRPGAGLGTALVRVTHTPRALGSEPRRGSLDRNGRCRMRVFNHYIS